MNKPKARKRASGDLSSDFQGHAGPAVLIRPVSDAVCAYLGAIVAEYTELERVMIRVFRVLLGIESGEAAALAYSAIRAANVRWEIARRVLENDNAHRETSTEYDDVIDEFLAITKVRNQYVHGEWGMDHREQPWLSSTSGTVVEYLKPRRIRKADFDNLLHRIEKLSEKVIDLVREDLRILDQRWLERARQARGSSSLDKVDE